MLCLNIILGYIINLVITSIVHFIAYFISTNHEADIIWTKFFIFPNNKSKAIKFILSPDYWSASSFKSNALIWSNKYSECNLGKFISYSNVINLITTFLFFTIVSFNNYNILFLMIFVVRAVSRAFEIIIAFYNDVIDEKPKNSDLNCGKRLSLATKSYFEIILNFAIVYYLLNFLSENQICKYCICNKTNIHSIVDYLFFSIGISTFTSVKFDYCYLVNILISTQLFASLSLVYFALAKYISGIKS